MHMAKFEEIEQILLCIIQEDSNTNKINKKIQDFNDSNWLALYELATKSGLSFVFYSRLLSLKLKNIPSEFLSKLKNLYLLNLKRNILLEQELFIILSYLQGLNIAVIALKGPLLARYLYNDLALRQASCDLDLLVKYENIEETEQKLQKIGYSFPLGKGGQADFFHRFRKQITLQKHREGLNDIILDLHWDFRDRFINTHLEEFWFNAAYINLDGHRILAPSEEDLLLYLTLNAISDFDFVQIKYLYDIHQLITTRANNINWNILVSKARQISLGAVIFVTLRLCRDLFNTDIPQKILGSRKSVIRDNLIKLWINKKNILRFREKIASGYIWRHFVSSYILSKNIFACMRIIYNKIFLPMDEVMYFYEQPLSKAPYSLYIKRLLKPIIDFFKFF